MSLVSAYELAKTFAINFEEFIEEADLIQPRLNIPFLTVATGRFHLGKHGESICSGGKHYITGIGARGNMGKTTLAVWMDNWVMNNYPTTQEMVYDTEGPFEIFRFMDMVDEMPNMRDVDLINNGQISITNLYKMAGEEFWDKYREIANMRHDKRDKYLLTTPFLDKDGTNIRIIKPINCLLDSLSQFETKATSDLQNKEQIGSAKRNTESMRGSLIRNQMCVEMPGVAGRGGIYTTYTMHLGDDMAAMMDQYSGIQKKLSFMRNKVKFKNCPEKVTFLTNDCWVITQQDILDNDTTKDAEYPISGQPVVKGDTDMLIITIMNLRGKAGGTGLPIQMVMSQAEGIKTGLTFFHNIKKANRFGIGGTLQNFYLEFLPTLNLKRTTVRSALDENYELFRAAELTSDLLMLKTMHRGKYPEVDTDVEPKTLYEDLIKMGYDWTVLLDTVNHWSFLEMPSEKPQITIMDLLRMRHGLYVPFWFTEEQKKAIDLTKAVKWSPTGEQAA